MKALFISENENDWEHFKKYLDAYFPKIVLMCTKTSTEAMGVVSADGPFGFFIIDCHLDNTDVNQLGLDLMDFTGIRPILFLGTPEKVQVEITQELFQLNEYNESIFKPFERSGFFEEFKEKVNGALEWAKDEEYEQAILEVNPNDYIGMKIKSFYLYKSFPYDIYLRISQVNFVKLISADKPYSHSSLSKYAKKNVKLLFIKKDEQLKYLETESQKCIKSFQLVNYKTNDIFLLQLRSITIIHQYIIALGVNDTVIKLVDVTIDSIIKVEKQKLVLGDIFQTYPNFYEGVSSKSLLTAYIAMGIARKMGWESETTKSKLGICSILMDLTVPEESLCKINSINELEVRELSDKVKLEFLDHPIDSARFVKQFPAYSEIDFIISNHHELPNKKGFPNQPSNSKLTLICAVFNSAQYIAAEIDGEDITNNLLLKVMKSMSRNFEKGIFKETQKIMKKTLKITKLTT